MLKNLKRIGAAIALAMFVVPHFVLAATMAANTAPCLDDGAVPGDDVADTACDAYGENLVRDGNINTGNHIEGPEYPIEITLDFGAPLSMTGLTIYHMPAGGGGGDGNRIAASTTNANNKVRYSSDNVTYYDFGNIPAYDDAADMVAEVTGTASARYLKVINWENHGDAAGWFPTEFVLTYTASTVPEMGFWALLVILPVMFYVVYKSTPALKPTAS